MGQSYTRNQGPDINIAAYGPKLRCFTLSKGSDVIAGDDHVPRPVCDLLSYELSWVRSESDDELDCQL